MWCIMHGRRRRPLTGAEGEGQKVLHRWPNSYKRINANKSTPEVKKEDVGKKNRIKLAKDYSNPVSRQTGRRKNKPYLTFGIIRHLQNISSKKIKEEFLEKGSVN